MSKRYSQAVLNDLGTLWAEGSLAGWSDAELVRRYAGGEEKSADSAFSALMTRHGPLVLGTCRRLLRDPHDVEDAFQATFLVLVRKARQIRVGDSLAPWLYAVACRIAARIRARASGRER
jgi:DNA-directed RNA polymerase specialized sigma24 family protein